MLPYLSSNKFTTYPDQNGPNPKVSQVHAQVVAEILAGQLTPTAALQRMDAAYKEGAH